MKVSIGVSNRHVHLTQEHLEVLFGEGFKLEKRSDLTQPGMFASNSFVAIKTEKDEIEKVRIVGPVRDYTQVEISKTDAYKLGINPPIRDSGDLKGSSPIIIIGPVGTLNLKEGCIIPTRHIHIMPNQVALYGLSDKKEVSVRLGREKGGVINNVKIKESNEAFFELHIDTDDANAHLVKSGDIGEIL